MPKKQEKSKYWKFSCSSRCEFEGNDHKKIIPKKIPRTQLCNFIHGKGLFGRFVCMIRLLVRGHWIVYNPDGSICKEELHNLNNEKRRVEGYFELNKEVDLKYIEKNFHGGSDFVYQICDKVDVVPENYLSQEKE
jgi:hypothetical protein